MGSVLLAVGAFVGYVVAYKTYGRFLGRKLFNLDNSRPTAAVELEDDRDFVPTKAEIIFGHHYTSIAGTGPIVGPAIGIVWGWVPALLWVVLGSIFMGAVHDFGAIVVSMRNQGRSIGDLAGDYISPRVRMMFLGIVFVLLLIVIAVFCLVIATIFSLYPHSVIPIWFEIPIAMGLGYLVYRKKVSSLPLSILAVVLMYGTIVLGAMAPVVLTEQVAAEAGTVERSLVGVPPVVFWSILLLVYAYVASVLPVWRLLQPRDYINGHELFVAMGLLALGTLVAHPAIVAPAFDAHPSGYDALWPFLFVTIACGAISGFHSLVGSGTTSKQIRREEDARVVGYGSMLVEGMLAVLVIVAVAGGFGMGEEKLNLDASGNVVSSETIRPAAGRPAELAAAEEAAGNARTITGRELWHYYYVQNIASAQGLKGTLKAFVDGSANMLDSIGIPAGIALAIMGVFVASFAATTLDTATRLQRYVVSEFGKAVKLKPLENVHVATLVAVATAAALALYDGKGAGGMVLWPLFGATNQLLACLALLVVTTYLKKQGKPVWYTLAPATVMFVLTGAAMVYKLSDFGVAVFGQTPDHTKIHLLVLGVVVVALEIWMVVETVMVLVRGAAAPPAAGGPPQTAPA